MRAHSRVNKQLNVVIAKTKTSLFVIISMRDYTVKIVQCQIIDNLNSPQ